MFAHVTGKGHPTETRRTIWIFEQTFSNSGSHESRVRERTFEQWTPKLLRKEGKTMVQKNILLVCVTTPTHIYCKYG